MGWTGDLSGIVENQTRSGVHFNEMGAYSGSGNLSAHA